MMYKKILILITAVFLMTGCGTNKKEDPSVTPDTRESASITEIDFTQSDAEKLIKKAVDQHCGSTACKVTSVRISGSDLIASYTYESEGEEKSGDVTLHDVSVSPLDKTVYTVGREEYRDNLPEIDGSGKKDEQSADPSDDPDKKDDQEKKDDEEKKDDQEKDSSTKGKYDLPDHVDENEEGAKDDQKVHEESGVQIWRVYTNKGSIEFTGTYSGDSKFIIEVMDLKQKSLGEAVNMKSSGDIDGKMKVDEGYYYIKIEYVGGWSLYWNRIFE